MSPEAKLDAILEALAVIKEGIGLLLLEGVAGDDPPEGLEDVVPKGSA